MLLRALRDFNLGKLTSDDTSIFMGLLNDLFPKTLELVPRAVEKNFESKVRHSNSEQAYRPGILAVNAGVQLCNGASTALKTTYCNIAGCTYSTARAACCCSVMREGLKKALPLCAARAMYAAIIQADSPL